MSSIAAVVFYRDKSLSGALSAITAAVVGVILNLAVWFAIHTMFRLTRHLEGFGIGVDAPIPASVDVWSLALALCAKNHKTSFPAFPVKPCQVASHACAVFSRNTLFPLCPP